MTWTTVKLGDVCKIINGSTPLRSRKDFWEKGTVSWFTIDDLREQGRDITYTNQKITKLALEKTSLKMLPKNTVLLCCTASIGASAIARVEMTTNQQFNGLIPNTKKLIPEFLYYISTTITQKLINLSGSAIINFVAISKLKEIEISFPSVLEQQRIVAKLDATFAEIDKIINLTADKIEKERDLNLSALKSTFSNIKYKKKIGEIAIVIAGQSPESKYYNRNAKGIPFYQGKKEFGDYELKKPTFWTTKTTKEALKGDILLSVRAPVGETNMSNEKICIGRGLAAIRANKDYNSEFIYYFLNSIKKQIVGNTGAVFNSINKKQIEDILIPIQNLDEQNKTVNKIKLILSNIKKIHLSTKQKIHNLKILKSSILKHELKNTT